MDVVRKDVEELVKKELEAANEKFPLFSSAHEGYSVVKEETEEAEDDLEILCADLSAVWTNIKMNNDCCLCSKMKVIKSNAISLAVEAIQVAAMAQKFIDSLGKENNNG